jgi:PAS domain S-box-containing protein
MRSSEQIKAEIQEEFGFVPPFFEPATETAEVLENLWQQTLAAYVNNPLPALFKEKLFAYLSRYCSVHYCIICHSCALRSLGMTAQQVLNLLQDPPPNIIDEFKAKPMLSSTQIEPLTAWPAANSVLETRLYHCAILIYLKPALPQQYHRDLLKLLGSFYYNHLIAFIAYVKTYHQWVECHPELLYEADQRVQLHLADLLQQDPALGDFFANYNEKVRREYQKPEVELQPSHSILQTVIEGNTDAIFWQYFQEDYLMVHSTTAGLLSKSLAEIMYNTPLTNPDGTTSGFPGMVQDITSHKMAEAELQQAHQRLKFHVENSPLGLIEWDSQFRVKMWSQQAERIFGWKAEEVMGKSWHEWRHVYEEDLEKIRAACAGLLDGSIPRNISRNRNYTKDGRVIHCEWYNSTLLDASGNLVSLLSLVLDVTERQQAQEALAASERRFRSLIENATDMIVVIDSGGVCRYVSPSVERILGYPQEDIIDKFCSEFIDPEDLPLLSQILDRAMQNPRVSQKMIDYRVRHKDGSWRVFEAVTTNLLDDPAVLGVAINCRDITEGKIAEEALKQSDRKYYTLTKVAPVAIFHADGMGKCLYVNERWCEISGLSLEESMGQGWIKALYPSDRQHIFRQWYQAASENLPFQSEFRLQRPDGEISWVFAQAIAETGKNGEVLGFVGTLTDINERKQVEEQLRYYAFYDPLTGLPNRALLLNHLRKLLANQPHPPSFAVLFLEMNRFQVIKYSLGHLFADQLIIATGERIQTCLNNFAEPMWDFELRDNNEVVELTKPLKIPNLKFTLSRLGLDEFAILLADFPTVNDATTIADYLYQELQLPFNLDGREVFVTASIGIAPSSINYDRAEDFLRAADTAVHHAKQLGKAGGYVVFEPQWHAGALDRLQLETDLRWAIERQQLRVYYQPIVSLKNNRISGFEALVRWQHPTRGIVSPAEFIPLAEETGLIGLIDRWVLREACRQVAMWQEAFPSLTPLTLSVNLSGLELSQLGLIERIDQILRQTGLSRHTLKLEITESKLAGNTSFEIGMLEQLKALGIQLSIDDFGTGYSCLARLHQMPIDTLKIDRSFVSQMSVDSESLEIVRTIITLAHSLGMDAISEGIESASQLEQLVELECEYGQGYFFSKPVDSNTIWGLLSANW